MMKNLSGYFKPVVVILDTIAIAFFALSIMGVASSIAQPSFAFALRIGIVSFFAFNLGGFYEHVFKIFDQLLAIVTGGTSPAYSPWQQIDLFISKLLGFSQDTNYSDIKDGILGLLGGSWSFKIIGGMLTILGLYTLWTVLGFMFEAVFLYITSYLVIGFLLVLSPLVIPFAIFNYGAKYARQWLNLLIASMLAPMIAFAILYIFVGNGTTEKGLFMDSINTIFQDLPKDYLKDNLYHNQAPCSWGATVDKPKMEELAAAKCVAGSVNCDATETPIVQPNVLPASATQDHCGVKYPQLDFGKDDTKIKTSLFFSMLNLAIFAFLMRSMMQQVQTVASSIAGVQSYRGVAAIESPLAGAITQKIG
jgi:hypothetical protein